MPEAKEKARAVGFNHVALEVGDIDEALASTAICSRSSFGGRLRLQPSSIWAINFSHYRRDAYRPPTTVVTSG